MATTTIDDIVLRSVRGVPEVLTDDARLLPAPGALPDGRIPLIATGAWIAGTPAQVKTALGIASGDVSGLGALATLSTITSAHIPAGTVTLADMANIATARLLGRNTAGSGVPEELSSATAKTLLGIASGDVSGLGPLATLATGNVAPPIDVQYFTASGTWTKPTAPTGCAAYSTVEVILIGGGGGGGAGRKGVTSSLRYGGGGGGGGGYARQVINATTLGATETVTVGTGGAGGAAQTTNSTDGAGGSVGLDSKFAAVLAGGGQGGFGSGVLGIGGNGGHGSPPGVPGATASGTGATGPGGVGSGTSVAAGTFGGLSAAGGASGSGVTTGNAVAAGGVGGGQYTANPTRAGGVFGAAGANGSAPATASTANEPVGGAGGGGGGSRITSGSAGNGGAGALYGGGGGGGGAALDTTTTQSGAGGAGGAGFAMMISR